MVKYPLTPEYSLNELHFLIRLLLKKKKNHVRFLWILLCDEISFDVKCIALQYITFTATSSKHTWNNKRYSNNRIYELHGQFLFFSFLIKRVGFNDRKQPDIFYAPDFRNEDSWDPRVLNQQVKMYLWKPWPSRCFLYPTLSSADNW